MEIFIFLSSGLFLGWSLGANDAANIFGTAVGSKMIRFRTAAIVASVFVVLGAAVSGAGASGTLGELGSVNALAGAFVVALAAALSILWMIQFKLPVSTSQAIVGSIVGWNLFSGSVTDYGTLVKIVGSWAASPVIAAVFSFVLYRILKTALNKIKIHIAWIDLSTRIALLAAGAFGAYSLGANNIANVVGVFIPAAPFRELSVGPFSISGTVQLFIIGGLSIAAGIFTYSRNVMTTIGTGIVKLNPLSALVVVLSTGLVLFIFSSGNFSGLLASMGFPKIPLVPVSSSQAIVGAVIGIGISNGGRNINYTLLGKIALGWAATPIAALAICFVSLFIVQNVFNQKVYQQRSFMIDSAVIKKAGLEKSRGNYSGLYGITYEGEAEFNSALHSMSGRGLIRDEDSRELKKFSELTGIYIQSGRVTRELEKERISPAEAESLIALKGQKFIRKWQFMEALSAPAERADYFIRIFRED